MTEQGSNQLTPESKLPSREESQAWFNSLPPVPPQRKREVLQDIDRLHREVFIYSRRHPLVRAFLRIRDQVKGKLT